MKRTRTLITALLLLPLAALCAAEGQPAKPAAKPNVLFIAVDDLNHWVGHLGRNKQAKTPNIDRLAAMGVTFANAQCAAPVCNPSRAALLSGKRPGTTGIYNNGTPFEKHLKPEESLVTQFKNAGYETLGTGKLWHGGLGWPEQWTTIQKETVTKGKISDRSIGGIAFGPIIEGGDEAVSDTSIADYGISELGKTHEKPFFLTLGFHKPHMPWNVPRKYYDLHPLADIQLPPTQPGDLADVPPLGLKMAKPSGDHADVLTSGRWKEAVQAYLATISYLDGQIGRVLDAVNQSPHKDNTLIVFWGDHGWHLGEKEHWRKFTLWEEAARAPFIWVVPGVTQSGGVCKSPVDFMSVYPTLCELAGLPKPAWVEGDNIRPLLANPAAAWTGVGVTTFGQNNHAVRTDRWRYIRYSDGGEELYDHSNDEYEWTNLANTPEHAGLKTELAKHFPTMNNPEGAKGNARDKGGGSSDPANEGKKKGKGKKGKE